MNVVLDFVAKLIAAFLAAIVSDKRVERTEQAIREIDNAQNRNDVQFRDLGSIVERLRRIQSTGAQRRNALHDPAKPGSDLPSP